ncbi:hypothetical protein CKO51_25630 [Rhodopirellula sp. SM50]|nr:hypothetical protein CKO51_25630 [Rhodopirellula sp. SM50]
MEIICSPVFSESDLQTLYQSLYEQKRFKIAELATSVDWNKKRIRHHALAWAIYHNRLAIRIAVFDDDRIGSVYHEKIGLLDLRDGRSIGMEGSANESANAYKYNFERILVHEGHPGSPHRWVDAIREDFERLWNNRTPGIKIISLHKAFVDGLLQTRSNDDARFASAIQSEQRRTMTAPVEILKRPPRLQLRDYQQRAMDAWFAAGGRGIYSMATGSGKTITALATLESLYRRVGPPLVIIIVAPYLNLVDQWIEEAHQFGLSPINCSGSSSDWTSLVESAIYLNQTKQRPILSVVTTNTTFSLEPFQRILSRLKVRTVLIGDEVHNLGARHLSRKLPEKVSLRLGLSATPQRWMDEEGTQAVQEYFGETVIDFGLKEALTGPNAALCPYTYHPILVSLDDCETEEYMAITKQLARCMISPNSENLSDLTLALLLKRSRVVASAKGKLAALARVFEPYRDTRYNLIYCGDGRVEIDAASPGISRGVPETKIMRQVDAVTRLLGHDFQMNVAKYTAETDQEQRRVILNDFERGDKQALVAIRCLDEGIDIPKVRRAFILASSTNPRQFIQRRGRVLRRAEGKEKAEIYDFVVVPPLDQVIPGTPEFKTLRNLVDREMQRVVEFAKLAINGPQAIGELRPLLEKLRLLHLL